MRHRAELETGPGILLLPNPASGGGWTKIPVTCEVAGDWLRALLKDVPGPSNAARVATHSCKSSILSMCAKYGVEPAARRLLGYHTAGRDKLMIIYSRDAMAWPIRLMEEMIDSINAKSFDPDASRSGYFPRGADVPEDSKDVESNPLGTAETRRKLTTVVMRLLLRNSQELGATLGYLRKRNTSGTRHRVVEVFALHCRRNRPTFSMRTNGDGAIHQM